MDRKKKKGIGIPGLVLIGVVMIAALFVVVNLLYDRIVSNANITENMEYGKYSRHIAMIVDNAGDDFWQDTYAFAKAQAAQRDAFVELKETSGLTDYSLADLMSISIASGVDGIIVENDGSKGLEKKIDEAVDAGIPVVTVLKDAVNTKRICYVGINPYTMGKEYSKNLIPVLEKEDKYWNIAVFMRDDTVEGNDFQIFSEINTELMNSEKLAGRISLEAVRIPSEEAFGAEEVVRETLDRDKRPDLVICLDSMTTETVYQSIIDMNLAGEVQLVGYYNSANTIGALQRGNMLMTLVLSTEDMGEYAAEAVMDAIEKGRTNSYYGVDAAFITREEVK